MQQIFRMRPIQLISFDWFESLGVSGLEIEMRSLQFLVLLVVVDFVIDGPLFIVASLVDRLLGKSWFNEVELAEMPPTFATFTAAVPLVVM